MLTWSLYSQRHFYSPYLWSGALFLFQIWWPSGGKTSLYPPVIHPGLVPPQPTGWGLHWLLLHLPLHSLHDVHQTGEYAVVSCMLGARKAHEEAIKEGYHCCPVCICILWSVSVLFMCFILIVIVGWDLKSSHDPGRCGRLDWKHQNGTRMLRQGWQKWISLLCVPLINVFFAFVLTAFADLLFFFF